MRIGGGRRSVFFDSFHLASLQTRQNSAYLEDSFEDSREQPVSHVPSSSLRLPLSVCPYGPTQNPPTPAIMVHWLK